MLSCCMEWYLIWNIVQQKVQYYALGCYEVKFSKEKHNDKVLTPEKYFYSRVKTLSSSYLLNKNKIFRK